MVACKHCGQEWPRDPALEVPCPKCEAPIGKKCSMDHESIARVPNMIAVVEILVDRMNERRWFFPHGECWFCEHGRASRRSRPFADKPMEECHGCIYSHLNEERGKGEDDAGYLCPPASRRVRAVGQLGDGLGRNESTRA